MVGGGRFCDANKKCNLIYCMEKNAFGKCRVQISIKISTFDNIAWWNKEKIIRWTIHFITKNVG